MKGLKLKKGDTVLVTAGKDRGKQAKIERVLAASGTVLLPGVNQYIKHRKSQGEGKPGERITVDRPMDVAKVALVCPKCKQPTRVGYRFGDGKKIRVCRKCSADIDKL